MNDKITVAKNSSKFVSEFSRRIRKGGVSKYMPIDICPNCNLLAKDIDNMARLVNIIPNTDVMIEVISASMALYKSMKAKSMFLMSKMSEDEKNEFAVNLDALKEANAKFKSFVVRCGRRVSENK